VRALLALAFAATAVAESDYRWPLDLPPVLTSSFAEYRPGRLHAGIDLRTGGVGIPVYAAADGHVERIRCSPYGYGKAVYLRFDDGNAAVYAHLNDFKSDLAAYVHSTQHRRRSYAVDLYPKAGAFPVRRGDLIAYSGQTGVGVPHLHYELRDAAHRPINPRRLGIAWPDTTSPIIRKVLVVPADADSRINGDVLPVVLDTKRDGPNSYATRAVDVEGRYAVAIEGYDPSNEGRNKLGLHTITVSRNGDLVLRFQNDRLSYNTIHHGAVVYHPYLTSGGPFLALWHWPDSDPDIYARGGWGGRMAAPDDLETLRISVSDFFENTAEIRVPVAPYTRRAAAPPSVEGVGNGSVSLTCFDEWLVITAAFPAPTGILPALRIIGDPEAMPIFRRVDAQTFRTTYTPGPDVASATLHVAHPRLDAYEKTVAVMRRDDPETAVRLGDATVTVAPDSPFGALFLWEDSGVPTPPAEIRPIGKPLRLAPAGTPIDRHLQIHCPLPPDHPTPTRIHLYRAKNNDWVWVGGEHRDGGVRISTRQFGTYALFEDDQSPFFHAPRVLPDPEVAPRRPRIVAALTDIGSGIADAYATIDDQWLLMAYDPEREVLEWERDVDLDPGEQTITFHATDRAGNTATQHVRTLIPK
jgi:peptidase M23-like protein